MSDGTKVKRVDFILGAKDELTRVVKKAAADTKRELDNLGRTRGSIPLASGVNDRVALAFPKPDRSKDEQAIRDIMAGRIRAMRDAGKRARQLQEVESRLGTGDVPTVAGPSAADAMKAFGRSEASSRTAAAARAGGGGSPVEKDWYRKLKDQTDGLEKMGKIIKGIGALGIVSEVGRAMQKLPEIQTQYYENLKSGMTKTQAFATALGSAIPIVGDLAQGFRGLWTFLTTTKQDSDLQARKDEARANKDLQAQMRERNERRRGEVLSTADAQARDAGRRRALGMAKDPAERDRLSAEFDYQDKLSAAQALENKASGLSKTSEQDQVRSAAKQQRIAAEEEYRKKLKEIDDRANEQAFAADGAFRKRAEEQDFETQQSKLERAGQGIQAQKNLREKAFQEEMADLRAQRAKALEGLDPNDYRVGLVNKGFEAGKAAAERRKSEADAADAQQRAQDAADRARNRSQDLRGQDMSLAGRVAGLSGNKRLAEKIANQAQLESELNQINKDAEEQRRADATRAAEIESERRDRTKRALAGSTLTELEQRMAQARQYQSDVPSAFRGDTAALQGIVGQRGPADPAVEQAKKTVEAITKGLELQTRQAKATEKLQDLFADLIRNLKVIPT